MIKWNGFYLSADSAQFIVSDRLIEKEDALGAKTESLGNARYTPNLESALTLMYQMAVRKKLAKCKDILQLRDEARKLSREILEIGRGFFDMEAKAAPLPKPAEEEPW